MNNTERYEGLTARMPHPKSYGPIAKLKSLWADTIRQNNAPRWQHPILERAKVAHSPKQLASWIRDGACNPKKESYVISHPGDGSAAPAVLNRGQWTASSGGAVFLRNRETDECFLWSSSSEEPLPCNVFIRWRLKKGGVAFAVVFSDGSVITSDDPVDIAACLIFEGAAGSSAFFFSANGGAGGTGGYAYTTDQKLIHMGISFCSTIFTLASEMQAESASDRSQECFLDGVCDDEELCEDDSRWIGCEDDPDEDDDMWEDDDDDDA